MSKIISYQINPEIKPQNGIGTTYFPIRGWALDDIDIKNQTQETIKKRGFYIDPVTKHYIFHFPQSFVYPMRDQANKYIIFQYCKATFEEHYTTDIEIHADFIPRDQYCDSLVYYCNLQVPDDNRKYLVNSIRDTKFEIWFVDGSLRNADDHDEKIFKGMIPNPALTPKP